MKRKRKAKRANLPHRPPRHTITINPRRDVARLIVEVASIEGISVSRLLTEMIEEWLLPDQPRKGRR